MRLLQLHPTIDATSFKSKDEGMKKFLTHVQAPEILLLKPDCPVILVKNLSNRLVNGSRGTVLDFGQKGPIVHFREANITIEVTPAAFSEYDPRTQEILATRQQIPLRLAFAITIHKAQGMSLDKVFIECEGILVLVNWGLQWEGVGPKLDLW